MRRLDPEHRAGKGVNRTVPGTSNRSVRLILAALCIMAPRCAAAIDDPVRVQSGQLSGAPCADPAIRVYKGVPYAAPPVGDLRWRPPQPVRPWTGVRSAVEFAPVCPQPPDPTLAIAGLRPEKTSEDCLYLNIWTPAKTKSDRLPVMVWVHGGGFANGSGSMALYNGENLAKQGVVLVTINYRLGPLGFFAHPDLSKESPHGVSGNYGLLDQIEALRWVKRNIASFGGDPGRVTLFGESAGAMSVGYLMASPLTKGLFQRAIAESGSAFMTNERLHATASGKAGLEQQGAAAASGMLGASVSNPIAVLRAKSADEIVKGLSPQSEMGLQGGIRYAPVIDGYVIPDEPAAIFAAGKEQRVPLIVGTNADEGTLFVAREAQAGSAEFHNFLQMRYGRHAEEIEQLYPASTPAEFRDAEARVLTDGLFAAGARYWAGTQSRVAPVYLYQFTYVVTAAPQFASLGAFHGSEIPRVFGMFGPLRLLDDAAGRQLTHAMMGAWTRFAATGDPNGDGLSEWPKYDPASDSYMELGRTIMVKSHLRPKQVDLFEKIIAERRG
jgi:para-nitrobenzyl esterase